MVRYTSVPMSIILGGLAGEGLTQVFVNTTNFLGVTQWHEHLIGPYGLLVGSISALVWQTVQREKVNKKIEEGQLKMVELLTKMETALETNSDVIDKSNKIISHITSAILKSENSKKEDDEL